jgi:hypothetical protein
MEYNSHNGRSCDINTNSIFIFFIAFWLCMILLGIVTYTNHIDDIYIKQCKKYIRR